MFELKNITKTFGADVALSDVSLSITGGMNYIIGASGSGKTTLLRILSAMDTEYEGEVFYQDKNLKALRENEKQLKSILKKLDIEKIENQTIRTLSGGQKQRVAIARELMKNPEVLIADEPTAALDAKAAQEIANILCTIAKERTVIIVTHDTSLIQGKCSIFELDKGVLCKCDMANNPSKQRPHSAQKSGLSIKFALQMTKVNFKRQLGKMLTLIITMAVAASCLSVNFTGILGGRSDEAVEELIARQGNSILNLDIVSSFMDAGSKDADGNVVGGQSVSQDISHIMEQYQNDSRVEGITMISPLNDAVVNLEGKDFIIESSGQAPVFNKIVSGRNADNKKYEVVLPQALVKKMRRTNDEMIGKQVSFVGTVFNFESGEPVEMPVSFKATVSGVADTSYGIEFEGELMTFENEDALFLSLAVMKDIYAQAGRKTPSFAFTIRPTSPENYVELYDELMSKGIVPLGQIELIRDIVGLKGEATAQSSVSYALIAVLSVLAALSVCLVCSLIRKKEYAVYKLSGYTKASIATLTSVEYAGMFLMSGILCAVVAIILNVPVWLAITLSFGVSVLCFAENSIFALRINPLTALKSGGR